MIEGMGVRQGDNWQFFLIGGLVLFIVLVWIEVSRRDKKQRFLRITAIFFAIAALVALVIKPFYLQVNTADLTVVLTEGSTKGDSLKLTYPTANIIQWSDSIQPKHLSPNIIIDGYGIPSYDLWKVENLKVDFITPNMPSGIIAINYPDEIEEGEELTIAFKVNGLLGHKFVLQGLGERYDSALVVEKSDVLRLSGKLKAVGMYVLTLSHYDTKDQLINVESIPVVVNQAKKFDILFINAFPTFESRFLKQFLESSDHNYLVRNQISTDKYRYESRGTAISEMSRITEANLKSFDIVIINAEQLQALPANQQRVLANTIHKEGLGILIVAGNGELNSRLPKWASTDYKTVKAESFKLIIEKEAFEVPTSNYRFISNVLSEVVYADTEGNVAQSTPYGLGKITMSAFNSTYELSLAGNQSAYQNLWKTLLESCLKPQEVTWSLPEERYYVNQPMQFEVNIDSLSRIVFEDAEIAMKQNALVSDKWESMLWPMSSGWSYININRQDESRKWFYSHEPSGLKSVQFADRIEANSRRENDRNEQVASSKESKVAISLWWFYAIFTVSMSYLWLQPKLR